MSSTQQARRRVCLFGTSANPPTGEVGHVGIVKALSGMNRFDEIRVLPVYQHMFSAKRNQLLEYHHRIRMCELAFSGIAQVRVSMAEQVSFEKMAEGMM
jgi:nicotinic acid mononucleotide adenylyltransferase